MKTEEGRELRRLWSTNLEKNAGRPKVFQMDIQKKQSNPLEKSKKICRGSSE